MGPIKTNAIIVILLITADTLTAGVSPYIGLGIGGVAAQDARYAYQGTTTQSGNLISGGGAVLEAAAGLDFDDVPFRFEGAISVLANELDAVEPDALGGITIPLNESGMAVSALMINGYFDFPTGSFIEPYLFAGIGQASVFHELNGQDVDDTVGAVQLGAGLGFVLTDFFIIDLKYRYFETADYTVSTDSERLVSDFSSHQILAGFRVRF